MRPRIKICGLTREQDIDTVNQYLPDYIGFIFAPKSRRYIPPAQAALLRKKLAPSIVPVGVFVNAKISEIMDVIEKGSISMIQLHGQEDALFIEALRSHTKLPILKAYTISSAKDLALAEKSTADYILLDNGSGGTGEVFDWNLARNLDRPFFLAGGLTPQNVQDAVNKVKPYAVDVSSGVEGADGLKDEEKIRNFIQIIKHLKRNTYKENLL